MKLRQEFCSIFILHIGKALALALAIVSANSCRTRKGPEVKEEPPPIPAAAPVNTPAPDPKPSAAQESYAKFRVMTLNARTRYLHQTQMQAAANQEAQLERWAGIIRKLKPQIVLLSDFDLAAPSSQVDSLQKKLLAASPTNEAPMQYREFTVLKTEPQARSSLLFSIFPIQKSSIQGFRSFARAEIELPGTTLDFIALMPEQFDYTTVESNNSEELSLRQRYSDDLAVIGAHISALESRKASTKQAAVFIAVGNLSADPFDGPGGRQVQAALQAFLSNPLFNLLVPKSKGSTIAAALAAGVNISQTGPSDSDTALLNENITGNLRLQYILPSKLGLKVEGAAVFWPAPDEQDHAILGNETSLPNHHAVYADLSWQPVDPKQ